MYLYLRMRLRVARIFICVFPFPSLSPSLSTFLTALWQLYMWQCVIYCSFMIWTRIVHICETLSTGASYRNHMPAGCTHYCLFTDSHFMSETATCIHPIRTRNLFIILLSRTATAVEEVGGERRLQRDKYNTYM